MNYEITGTLIEIFPEVVISERFKKREFVIEKNDNNFVDQIKFQLTQEKTGLIDSFQTGDQLNVSFNIKGSKWKDTYFVNLQAWRIEKATTGNQSVTNDVPPPSINEVPPMEEEGDDLPF